MADRSAFFAKAIENCPNQLFIDGKFVDAQSKKTFATLNPCTGKELKRVAEADAADVELALKAAHKAFKGPWRKMAAKDRGTLLNKLLLAFEEHKEELIAIECMDTGKPYDFANRVDYPVTHDVIRYFAGYADKIHGKTIPVGGGYDEHGASNNFAYTIQEPIGVIGAIVPWNYPMVLAMIKVIPALTCGCTLVLKPPELTPLSALKMCELFSKVGLPPGVLNVVPGFGATAGAALVNSKLVDKLTFTGSGLTGAGIAAAAAKNIKPVTLELGGKSPVIVWKDVDVKKAAMLSYQCLFGNTGQTCIAGSRTFVHEDIYDAFVAASIEMNKVLDYIESGKSQGATVATGGKRIGNTGYFIEPTIMTNVQDNFKIAREEIFGPVQSILKYKTLDEVIERANDTEFGLGAFVMAQDTNVIHRLVGSIKAGNILVNSAGQGEAAIPFGGYKNSGVGREKGKECLHNYLQNKAVYQEFPTL